MKLEAVKKLIKESVKKLLFLYVIIKIMIKIENKINNSQKIDPSKYIMMEQFQPNSTQSTGDPIKDIMMQTQREANDLTNFM